MDRVIDLDTPLEIRKRRIMTQFMKWKLGLESCHNRPTLAMLKVVFRRTRELETEKNRIEVWT
ncbi:MAG: hypothetical protein PUB18_00220 [bacterium]|nr:hypothetical protein [bacterium]